MTTIYLDENLSEYVANALNSLNKGYFPQISVYSTKEKMGIGKPDEEIIPKIGNENSILVTRDINIKKTRLQYELCKQFKLGVFFLDLPKGENRHWDLVRALVSHWEEIVEKTKEPKRPFAYRVRKNGALQKM